MAEFLDVSDEAFLEKMKDKLFIDSGEDVEDLFIAFDHYKLK
jgi:hypothetical protein